jgi:hypothetical protein
MSSKSDRPNSLFTEQFDADFQYEEDAAIVAKVFDSNELARTFQLAQQSESWKQAMKSNPKSILWCK